MKNGLIESNNKALIQDDLQHEDEGFGNNVYRNFSPILNSTNLDSGSFIHDLQTENYLVAHGASYANDTSAFTMVLQETLPITLQCNI